MAGAQYGVTPPISTEPSSQREIDATAEMVAYLRSSGQYESEEEARKRTAVLARLSDMIQEFVRRVSLKRQMPESVANETTGKLFTFGSYRLGVHGSGASSRQLRRPRPSLNFSTHLKAPISIRFAWLLATFDGKTFSKICTKFSWSKAIPSRT